MCERNPCRNNGFLLVLTLKASIMTAASSSKAHQHYTFTYLCWFGRTDRLERRQAYGQKTDFGTGCVPSWETFYFGFFGVQRPFENSILVYIGPSPREREKEEIKDSGE